jgi:hypothetical protein
VRDYAKTSPRFWTGETGRLIRKFGAPTQVIAFYLFTCPNSNMIGLYYLPLPTLCHETGSTLEGASKALLSLSEVGFAYYDEESELVFLPNMAREQIGDRLMKKDNRHKAVLRELEQFRKSSFFNDFLHIYRHSYELHDVVPNDQVRRASQAPSEPLRSQEQEQEQKQKQEHIQERGRAEEFSTKENGGSSDDAVADMQSNRVGMERVKAAYPKFANRQDWINAQVGCLARIEQDGQTWNTLVAATERYAKHIRAKGSEGTQFVMTPGKFFAAVDRPWSQEWPIPTAQGAPAAAKSETPFEREWKRLRADASSSGFHRDPHEGETLDQYRAALKKHENDQAATTMQRLRQATAAMSVT